jgi:hypothetical protein
MGFNSGLKGLNNVFQKAVATQDVTNAVGLPSVHYVEKM